jgi:hypothetical protein
VLNEDRLQVIVIESLAAELNELVADVRENCCLAVDLFILANFRNDAALDVAEQPSLSDYLSLTLLTGF